MTIHKHIVRVNDERGNLAKYTPRVGVEMVIKPFKPLEVKNLYDVMFRGSDMNPCLSERMLMEDINKEVERLKFIYSDRVRDSPFRDSKIMPDQKTFIRFRDFEDSDNLKDLDEFKSKAEVIYGDKNQVSPDNSLRAINEEYIKAKKKYLSLIDRG